MQAAQAAYATQVCLPACSLKNSSTVLRRLAVQAVCDAKSALYGCVLQALL